jgi:homopolymeric O-antigen transport system permease protein
VRSGEELPQPRRSRLIAPRRGWQPIDWRELLAYKDLLYFLVWRDVKALYAQTVLGLGWALARPLFSMVVFTLVFGRLARIPSDGAPYALFAFTALVPWTYFATAMNGASQSLIGNGPLLSKVYFPRLVIPLTPVLAGLVDLTLSLALLGVLLLGYGVTPTLWALTLPLLVLLLLLTALGMGLWLSALSIQYRDVKHGAQFLSQVLMYAAPVVWPVSLITERFPEQAQVLRLVYGLYPLAGVIEGFRSALLGTQPMPWDLIGVGALSSTCLALSGAYYFRRTERVFADVA